MTASDGSGAIWKVENKQFLDKLPQRAKSNDKTSGIFVAAEHEQQWISGRDGPARSMPSQSSGFDIVSKTHIEGHAAAFMHQNEIAEARLYINNSEICPSCQKNLSKMLPLDARLEVVLVDGTVKVFVGGRK